MTSFGPKIGLFYGFEHNVIKKIAFMAYWQVFEVAEFKFFGLKPQKLRKKANFWPKTVHISNCWRLRPKIQNQRFEKHIILPKNRIDLAKKILDTEAMGVCLTNT